MNQDCNTKKKGGYEQICCTHNTASMGLYKQCMWNGKPGECDKKSAQPVNENNCPVSFFTSQSAASAADSGGAHCRQINGLGNDGFHMQH